MDIGYGTLKTGSAAVAQAMADVRSARNLQSRKRAEQREERAAETLRRRRKKRDDREAEVALKRRVRITVAADDRPRNGARTPRRLYHRAIEQMLKGTTGFSDARGPDRLYSIHFSFMARGFASRNVRRWRAREAERAALYAAREDALEGGELGWWSSIAQDRNELAAHYRASEALEKHDRTNANVYIAEVIALPAELSARQRRLAVRRICRWFEERGLPHTVGIHLPDPAGDQRNYHCHIVYSVRPCQRLGAYDWSFGAAKATDINTPEGIVGRRLAVVRAINATLHAANIDKRYTHLSNKARGMAPPSGGKVGQAATWYARRLAALEHRVSLLAALGDRVGRVRDAVTAGAARLGASRATLVERTMAMRERLTIEPHRVETVLSARRQRTAFNLQSRSDQIEQSVDAFEGATLAARRRTADRLDAAMSRMAALIPALETMLPSAT